MAGEFTDRVSAPRCSAPAKRVVYAPRRAPEFLECRLVDLLHSLQSILAEFRARRQDSKDLEVCPSHWTVWIKWVVIVWHDKVLMQMWGQLGLQRLKPVLF